MNQETLQGTIERVTFHNTDNGFCVLKIKTKKDRDLVTLIGHASQVNPGEYVDCTGEWITDKEYGLQFKAQILNVVLPSTLAGIEKYLGSGLIRGIGPHFAKRLVNAFGDKVFEVIENEPWRLTELPGIGQQRRERILASWKDQKSIQAIMVFLQSHGIGTARAVRIYKTYGQSAIEKVQENPYRLALDIRGIGFKTADQLAERLGIPKDSLVRVEAGIRHVLQESSGSGQCAMHREQLVSEAATLLEVDSVLVEQGIESEVQSNRIILEDIDETPSVFLAGFYRAEKGVVEHLKRLYSVRCEKVVGIDVEGAIPWVEDQNQFKLSESQKAAIRVALNSKVVIITGGPGVGKTTLVNSLLQILRAKVSRIQLAAPTGRAAKRLSEATQLEAKTLHRLLEFDPKGEGFKRQEKNPLDCDCLVVDEVSMVDILMMYALLRAVPSHALLVLVGDVDQLPSVGPGAVLSDLIQSEAIPVVRLTEIFRQAKQSKIVTNAHRVNRGYFPETEHPEGVLQDFYFIPAKETEDIQSKLIELVTDRIPKRFGYDPIRDIQVLAPMNRGGLGARALNTMLQGALNPSGKYPVMRFGLTFAQGDKVIQLSNNYQKEVFNGDIGLIEEIDSEEGLLWVRFDTRVVEYELNELDELTLAYATTIHKSQGSEYPVVVLPIAMQHFMLLERNLLYTGITRGKSLVIIVGQKQALAMAVKNVKSHTRLTNLKHRLMESLALSR